MKKPPTKEDLRDQLAAATSRFIEGGGEVKEIPQGQSGKDAGDAPVFLNRRIFTEPKTSRTPVPEVVAAIEARRKKKPEKRPGHQRRLAKPRRKVIYDDFGEPLRKVWVDD